MNRELITCPRCKKPGTWMTKNPYRPFCSERCKLIDLGAWADEAHRITGESSYINDPTIRDDSGEEKDH